MPRRKRKLIKRKAVRVVALETTEGLQVIGEINPLTADYARLAAENLYVCSISGISLADIHARPDFKDLITLQTLDKWCNKGRWVDKRKAWREMMQKGIQNAAADTLIKSQLEALKELEALDKAVNEVLFIVDATTGELRAALEAKSLEGMLGVKLKVLEALDERRKAISASIVPNAIPADESSGLHPNLRPKNMTEDEGLAVAKLLMRMRREAIEAELQANPLPPIETKPKKKPPPQ